MAAIVFKTEPDVCNCGGAYLVIDGTMVVCASVGYFTDSCKLVIKLSDNENTAITVIFYDNSVAEMKFNEVVAAINGK